MRPSRFRIAALFALDRVLARIAQHIETARERIALCPDCGRNRYTGRPCK